MVNRLKEKRKEMKITQQKLANLIDISISHYTNIERSDNIPSVEIALKIAKELSCNVEDIFALDKKEWN